MKEEQKKLIIGWFTFTCCEDSTIIMTELLNDHWQDWTKKIDFKYAKILRKSRKVGPMDVAFVEGAISSNEQLNKLKEIRQLAEKLVAIGSCAVIGQPSAQRNSFSAAQKADIKAIMDRFQYAENVKRLDECVTIDYKVPGCPMNEAKFLELIDQLIKNHASN